MNNPRLEGLLEELRKELGYKEVLVLGTSEDSAANFVCNTQNLAILSLFSKFLDSKISQLFQDMELCDLMLDGEFSGDDNGGENYN